MEELEFEFDFLKFGFVRDSVVLWFRVWFLELDCKFQFENMYLFNELVILFLSGMKFYV